jgi:serine/threonine-protein kinase
MRYAVTACLLALCSAWLSFDLLFVPRGVKETRVEIPQYCGDALENAEFADWMETEILYRHDPAPAGTVLSQEPTAGSLRKLTDAYPICRVRLTVSLGEESVALPDLLGMDQKSAEARLLALGLSADVTVKETEGQGYPSGRVLSMQPSAGTRVPKGSEVRLTVSSGDPVREVRVPDLRGLSRAEALMLLWRAGLTVDEVIETPSPEPSGRVIGQSLVAGTLVEQGTKITVYVATESDP